MTSASKRVRLIAPLLAAAWTPVAAAAAEAERCASPAGRVAAVEGRIEVGSTAGPVLLAVGDAVCLGDVVRAGRQVAIVLASGAVLRLDGGAELRVDEEVLAGGGRTFLDLLFGRLSVFSRRPHALEVGTPFANAAVEGTEFAVEVERDRSRVAVLEGRVRVSNPRGSVRLEPGDAAVAVAGRAPEIELRVRPRDAVRWALYYPPLGEARLPPASPAALREAVRLEAEGERAAALARLAEVPPAARDATYETVRAELLLGLGRVEEAETAIGAALAKAPEDPDALALRAVVAVVRNEKEQALADARRAVAAAPANARARLALSYAAQASFDIPLAREQLEAAVEAESGNALAWARLAEIRLAEGDTRGARRAAERAVALDPASARAWTVRGFVALARIDTRGARAAFERATELEPFGPTAQFGLGLATIRDGDLAAGRGRIELAVALDPGDALLRSYLGKAYLEERRSDAAGDAFAIARTLDPNDPTPWFYDAIRKQAGNQPIPALRDLNAALARNDNRAVFRSRFLLDQDLAVRSARQGFIYRDLGFQELALLEGWNATASNPADESAHQLLADTYAALPRSDIARDSERLQALLLSPLRLGPLDPRRAGQDLPVFAEFAAPPASFGEFGRLFARDGWRLDGDAFAGSNWTDGGQLAASVLSGPVSASIGAAYADTDGERRNENRLEAIGDAVLQAAVSPRTSVLAESRRVRERAGDLGRLFDPDLFDPREERRVDLASLLLGVRHDFRPGSVGIGAATVVADESESVSPGFFDISTDERSYELEYRHILQAGSLVLSPGVALYHGDLAERVGFFGEEPDRTDETPRQYSGYLYATERFSDSLILTGGVAIERIRDVGVERDQINPKAGIIWRPTLGTTVRMAAFRVNKRALVNSQTLEPTNIAGFNQYFDDITATDSWEYGVGFDQRIGEDVYTGVELVARDLDIPKPDSDRTVAAPRDDGDERSLRFYVNWTASETLAISSGYRLSQIDNISPSESSSLFNVTTHALPVRARFFSRTGLLGEVELTGYAQDADYSDRRDVRRSGEDRFLYVRTGIGYRFLQRQASAYIGVENLLDQQFDFEAEESSNDRLFRDRVFLGRLRFAF